MKITDYRRSALNTLVGTSTNSLAISGVTPSGAAASNYILVATSSNTATWTAQSSSIAAGTYFLAKSGGQGVLGALGNLGASETVSLVNGLYQTGTLNANCTISFTGWTTGTYCEVGLRLTEDGTGGWTPTFSGVTWTGGSAPAHTTTAGSVTDYVFWSTDGGSTTYGGQIASAAISYSSNANNVAAVSAGGAASTLSRGDHVHVGVTSLAHTSNTYSGPVILTASGTLGITSPSAGTFNLSATGGSGGGGGGAPSEYESFLSADRTIVNATTWYSSASLGITPASGTYEVTVVLHLGSAHASSTLLEAGIAKGGSLDGNGAWSGGTVYCAAGSYNSAGSGGGTTVTVVARVTVNGSEVIYGLGASVRGSSDSKILTTDLLAMLANKASSIHAVAVTSA